MTPNEIFNLVDPVVAMQRYFPGTIETSRRYRNPFRIDNSASCYFGWSKSGRFVFYDPAKIEYSGDAIKIVMLRFNLDFKQAMEKINNDFNLGLNNKSISSRTELTPLRKKNKKREVLETKLKRTHFQIHVRNWNKKDQEYWLRFGIDIKLLKKYNVFPVKKYYTKNRSQSTFKLTYTYDDNREDPCYCYKLGNDDPNVKLYRPFNKENKWRSNTDENDIQGLEQLPDKSNELLIITSSMKDLLSLVSIGYDAIAPQAEGIAVPEKIIKKLKLKYKRIIFIYDADDTGHKETINQAKKANCEYRLLQKYNDMKDFADIRSVMSEEDFKLYVKNIIENES